MNLSKNAAIAVCAAALIGVAALAPTANAGTLDTGKFCITAVNENDSRFTSTNGNCSPIGSPETPEEVFDSEYRWGYTTSININEPYDPSIFDEDYPNYYETYKNMGVTVTMTRPAFGDVPEEVVTNSGTLSNGRLGLSFTTRALLHNWTKEEFELAPSIRAHVKYEFANGDIYEGEVSASGHSEQGDEFTMVHSDLLWSGIDYSEVPYIP